MAGVIIVPPVGAPLAAPGLGVDAGKGGRSMLRPYKNQILPAAAHDWLVFRTLAQQEGWRVPKNELSLHQQGGCSRAWALRRDNTTIGLVTGVRHQKSAWIGNLIITPAERGRGYGVALFTHVVKELRAAGVTTLWLTASAQGAPLYATRGFQRVGQIERWVREKGGGGEREQLAAEIIGAQIDATIWGDDRNALLHHLESAGNWLHQGESLALVQQGEDLQIIGPWYGSRQLQDDAALLTRLVALAAPQQELVIDLVADSGRQSLLAAAGFTHRSSTGLMVAGPTQVQWSRLLALATLGSCG
jgi:N-acetylglutamate synthase-like GNAT family acetyltransferase